MQRPLLLSLFLVALAVTAEDWPTYMHDPARGGVSGETLPLPLAPLWAYQPVSQPIPAWPTPPFEFNKITFDDATHVAMAGGTVFLGSPVDNGIHAFDAASGKRLWTFFTEGPVRLAPTFADGRVYAGSDDGILYCLNATDGKLVWSVRPFPDPKRMIGAGRLSSIRPVRTGALVDNGVVYCGAGVFPDAGTRLFAFEAASGKQLWASAQPSKTLKFAPPIPQGYLVAGPETLFVSRGRAVPQIFSRADGIFKAAPAQQRGGLVSGTYGLFAANRFFSGSQDTLYGFNATDGKSPQTWENTSQLVFGADHVFSLAGPVGRRGWNLTPRSENPVTAFDRKKIKLGSTKPNSGKEAVLWTFARPGLRRIIVAGPHLIAGGAKEVYAVEIATGKQVWKAPLPAAAQGLAAANGRLAVSLADGSIHFFGAAEGGTAGGTAAKPAGMAPAAAETKLAAELLKNGDFSRGFALVAGGANNLDLGVAIAQASGLFVHVFEPDADKAAGAREKLLAAGLYGARILVDTPAAEAPEKLPYPPYFANLVVADAGLLQAREKAAVELLRVLRPCGGRLYLAPGAQAAPENWAAAGQVTGKLSLGGTAGWLRLERGPLPGAGEWTHLFGNAGNWASSDDTLIQGVQFDVLWYGEPGPANMQDRHTGTQAPLFADGRVFVQGKSEKDGVKTHKIFCFDAYNGVPYWERPVPGAERLVVGSDCGNLAASAAGVFVAAKDECLHLDARTGNPVATYKIPPGAAAPGAEWAFVALADGMLVGSAAPTYRFSNRIFAYDLATGKLAWEHQTDVVRNATIAVNGGKVFFAEHRGGKEPPKILKYYDHLKQLAEQKKKAAAKPKAPAPAKAKAKPEEGDGDGPQDEEEEAPPAQAAVPEYKRTAVALDLKTGRELWAVEVDLTDCGAWGNNLSAAAKDGTLAFFGNYNAYGRPKGDEPKRRVLVLDAATGATLWNKPFGNFVRPVLMADMIVSRPYAFNLKTGEQILNKDGKPWKRDRLGACGQMSASAHSLFYRYGASMFVNFTGGARSFNGMRPGCYINMIPAGGLLIQPEASAGCSCDHAALQASIVLVPPNAR